MLINMKIVILYTAEMTDVSLDHKKVEGGGHITQSTVILERIYFQIILIDPIFAHFILQFNLLEYFRA